MNETILRIKPLGVEGKVEDGWEEEFTSRTPVQIKTTGYQSLPNRIALDLYEALGATGKLEIKYTPAKKDKETE